MLTNEIQINHAQAYESKIGRALLVVNAKARQGRENFNKALQELEAQGIKLVNAHAVANPRFIKPLVARALEREKIETVVVGGGDGTLSLLADLLAHRKIKLGVIPMGTANDFARNLAITTDIERAVSVIKDAYALPIDLGQAGEQYFLNVASIGLGVEVASRMNHDLKKWIGPLAYGVAAFEAVKEMRPVGVRLTFKDQPVGDSFKIVECKALHIVVANGRFYGGGMVSAPDATIVNKMLMVSVIENMEPLELVTLLPGLRDGSYVHNPKVHHYSTTHVAIETHRPRSINMDGEICQSTPIEFKAVPAALQVFVPRPEQS